MDDQPSRDLSHPGQPSTSQWARDNREDDFRLTHLWLVLVKRRRAIMLVFLLCLLVGLAVALLTPKIYAYTATIEVGSLVVEQGQAEQVRLIDDPQTVLAKLVNVYIPLVQQQFAQEHPKNPAIYPIRVFIPPNSQVVVLEGKGPLARRQDYLSILNRIVAALKEDHQRPFETNKRALEVAYRRAMLDSDALRDAANVIRADIKRVDENAKLLDQQIAELKELLRQSQNNRTQALKDLREPAQAMTLLMIDTEMQQNRARLGDLGQSRYIDLEKKRDSLNKDLADNGRNQLAQQKVVEEIKGRLDNLRQTHALVPPMQLHAPVGLSRTAIMAIAAAGGLLLGLLVALFSEFLAGVRGTAAGVAVQAS